MKHQIDLNCDLGEGGAFDAELMPLITSCNIACGGHYGNSDTIKTTIDLAKQFNVKIGAHPSYPDPTNFGRQSMIISQVALRQSLKSQIQNIYNIAHNCHYPLTHIKPHGALYNDAICDKSIAQTIIDVLLELNINLPLFAPPKSLISKLSKGKIDIVFEGFSDRNYNNDYSLVSRQNPNALLKTSDAILKHVSMMIKESKVISVQDEIIQLDVDTICMHSDTKNAVKHLEKLRTELLRNNIEVVPYEH